jgi:hypothetical protein
MEWTDGLAIGEKHCDGDVRRVVAGIENARRLVADQGVI